jgi:hypothetical protein
MACSNLSEKVYMTRMDFNHIGAFSTEIQT